MKKIMVLAFALIIGSAFASAQQAFTSQDEYVLDETIAQYAEDNPSSASFFEALKDASFPTEANYDYAVADLSRNPNKVAAGVLSILLGDLGVGHFYTGQTLRGVLDILFCWTGIPAIIGLVEGIIWLCEDDAAWAARVARWNGTLQ